MQTSKQPAVLEDVYPDQRLMQELYPKALNP